MSDFQLASTEISSVSLQVNVANDSLNLVLFGSTAAVKAGDGCLLPDYSGGSVLRQLEPVECKIVGRNVSVINMTGLHEANYCQESMDNYMGQTLGEDGIHAFLYMLPPQRLTDEDKMAVEWLQKVFGTSSLHVLIIVFTYENEDDCDSIIDDLKRNTVLEQLIEKSGGRYFTLKNSLNNEREMEELLQKIDLMISDNNTYDAKSLSKQLKMRQTIPNSEEHRRKSGKCNTVSQLAILINWIKILTLDCVFVKNRKLYNSFE